LSSKNIVRITIKKIKTRYIRIINIIRRITGNITIKSIRIFFKKDLGEEYNCDFFTLSLKLNISLIIFEIGSLLSLYLIIKYIPTTKYKGAIIKETNTKVRRYS
jgi:hypothetical protein